MTAGSAIPSHLPDRLTISLWDFSWYTQGAPGKPFHDLDAAFAEAVERGYNTVRICAMPFLLFGDHDVDTHDLRITGLGRPGVGQRIRWYDVEGGGPGFDGRARLRELFEAARRHDCYIILSSWEYQQSPSFLETREWYDALEAVPHGERHRTMANAMVRLIAYLKELGLADQIAYAELHNEVDLTKLVPSPRTEVFWSQRQLVTDAVGAMQQAHPDIMATSCYGIPPYHDMGSVAENGHIAHFHMYVYGVLGALDDWAGVRVPPPEFPRPELLSLLRDDAPTVDSWAKGLDIWRLQATEVMPSMLYAYEWVDPAKWDRWLYENYHAHRVAMTQGIDDKLDILARWAAQHNVPAVIGEGWIGYTPLYAEFEDGPIGQSLAEHAIERCIEHGFWGAVLGSNSAPHHPGWRNIEWQQKWNKRFRES